MKHLIALASLIDAAGIATQGETLFLLTMPAEVQDAVMLRGPIAGDPISSEMPGVVDTEFLCVVRHEDELAAYDRMTRISKLLTIYRRSVSDVSVVSCEPQTLPISYPRNEAGTLEWAVRFRILFAMP